MTKGFSEAEARMLDRFAPPPLSPGFADRIMARLPHEAVTVPRRRDPRGGWRRGRIALIAGVGSALLSVGAAASGILGVTVQNMPVITTIADAVDAPRAASVVKEARPAKAAVAIAKPKAPIAGTGVTRAEPAVQPTAALVLADQIEARMRWRDAQGLSVPALAGIERRRDALLAQGNPRAETMTAAIAVLKERADAGTLPAPRTQRQVNAEQWRARMASLFPQERAAAQARREWRRQQRLAADDQGAGEGGGAPARAEAAAKPVGGAGRMRERWLRMTPEERAEWRARRAAREAMMTPEQRQRLEAWRAARRQQMQRAPEGVTAEPDPAPGETDTPQ